MSGGWYFGAANQHTSFNIHHSLVYLHTLYGFLHVVDAQDGRTFHQGNGVDGGRAVERCRRITAHQFKDHGLARYTGENRQVEACRHCAAQRSSAPKSFQIHSLDRG